MLPRPDEIQQLLTALRTIATYEKAMGNYTTLLAAQRDRLIVQLHEAGLTLRDIAPAASMHHTRVGKILKKKQPSDERTLFFTSEVPNWTAASPQDIRVYLDKHHRSEPVPTNEEIQTMLDDFVGRAPSVEGHSMAWPWWASGVWGVMEHAIRNRASVTQLEVLAAVRAIMISANWRVVMVGEDVEPERRQQALDLMNRLLTNATVRDWELNLIGHLDQMSPQEDFGDT